MSTFAGDPRAPLWNTSTTKAALSGLVAVTAMPKTPTIPAGCTGIMFTQNTVAVVAATTDIWISINGGLQGTGVRLVLGDASHYFALDPADLPTFDVWGTHATTAAICGVTFFFG